MKKPKIVVVGVGNTGVSVVDLLSKEFNQEDVKLIKVDHYNNLKFDQKNQYAPIEKNPKITDIELTHFSYKKISIEELSVHQDDPVCNKDEILKLLSMVEEGDEIYLMNEQLGCFGGDKFGFKLTRDGQPIMKTAIFKKEKPLPIQDESVEIGWLEKIKSVIFMKSDI